MHSSEALLRHQLHLRREQLDAAIAAGGHPQFQHLLLEVDAALERLAADEFGQCTVCHESLSEERLLADPLHHICLQCLSEGEARALEHDLETAANIQRALLPDRHLRLAGWEIRYEYQPQGPVSGDHLDFIAPEGAHRPVFFFFADAVGKGVSGSLLGAHLHALFRSLAPLELPLDEVLQRANRIFCASTLSTSYATLIAGRLWSGGEVEICNLGHCPPLWVQRCSVRPIQPSGLPFGLFDKGSFTVQELALAPGDFLFFYTDGLSESQNGMGEEYGQDRLAALLCETSSRSAAETLAACLADIRRFRNGGDRVDDLTVMICERSS